MRYNFVGDIHGRVEAVEDALLLPGLKVFVGDFVDSYDRTVDDMEKCLVLALDAADKGEAVLLYGNHELSYVLPDKHRCSGYKNSTEDMLVSHLDRITKHFKCFYQPAKDWLITHAGCHPLVWDKIKDDIPGAVADKSSPAHWIGQYRGGINKVGGIFWCDFNAEFKPVDNLNQVFGHSASKGTEVRKMMGTNSRNYCVDCLDKKQEFLTLDL